MNANEHFNRGNSHQAQGNYAAAITDYTNALQLFVENIDKADCYHNRGITHKAQGNYAAAITDHTNALQLFVKNIDKAGCYYNRGNTHKDQGNYAAAITDYTNALQLYVENIDKADCYFNRGNSYKAQGNYAAAIEDFTHAIHLNPNINITFTPDELKNFFKHHPDFYDQKLKSKLNFCQRQSMCYEGEAPEPSEEYEDLIDPVTCLLMNDPITPNCGQTYDRKTIEDIFKQQNHPQSVPCPFTKRVITKQEFENINTNFSLKKRIEKYVLSLERMAREAVIAEYQINPAPEGQLAPSIEGAARPQAAAAANLNPQRESVSRQAWLARIEAQSRAAQKPLAQILERQSGLV